MNRDEEERMVNTKSIQVRMTKELLERLARESDRRGLKATEMIRFAISQAVSEGEMDRPSAGGRRP